MGTLALVLAVGAFLVLSASLVSAGKPDKPPQEPVDTGTVYFYHAYQMWSMNPDGSGKAPVIADLSMDAEPSHGLHANARWFLQFRGVPGETYPDDRQRFDLYAVSEFGPQVQLTDDPDLQPFDRTIQPGYPYDAPEDQGRIAARWTSDDGMVSWLARRWGLHEGETVVLDVGIYAVMLDADVSTIEGPLTPVRLLVDVPAYDYPEGYQSAEGLWPLLLSYDWSPLGDAIVYAHYHIGDGFYTLHIADVPGETFALNANGTTFSYVRWSADGTKIAFFTEIYDGDWDFHIDTINPDGTGQTTILTGDLWKGKGAPVSPHWSPSGTHLVYERNLVKMRPELGGHNQVCRAAADGSHPTSLTNTLDYCYPQGWRAD